MRGIFVTGTDTNVGKTIVSAALLLALRGRENVRYWKPIQTGIETGCDTRMVRELTGSTRTEVCTNGYRLEKPLSPHLSARLAGIEIELRKTTRFIERNREDYFWIVEGAGGAMV